MLPEERREKLLEELHLKGKVVVVDFSKQNKVSVDTVRRDIRELSNAGLLKRVHGGAMPLAPNLVPFSEREDQAVEEKELLASAAASLVRDGQVIIFDGGTTNLAIANRLPVNLWATAITINPQVALVLSKYPYLDVIMIGGKLDKGELNTSDPEAIRQVRNFQADLGFLGVCSIHSEVGLSTKNYKDVAMMQAIIQSSGEIVSAVTADKLETTAPFIVSPIDKIDYIITEANASDDQLKAYTQMGIQIIKPD